VSASTMEMLDEHKNETSSDYSLDKDLDTIDNV
jgi:hypothetical protein